MDGHECCMMGIINDQSTSLISNQHQGPVEPTMYPQTHLLLSMQKLTNDRIIIYIGKLPNKLVRHNILNYKLLSLQFLQLFIYLLSGEICNYLTINFKCFTWYYHPKKERPRVTHFLG